MGTPSRNMSCCDHDTAVKAGAGVALSAGITGAFFFLLAAALPWIDCHRQEFFLFDDDMDELDAVDGTRATLVISFLINIVAIVLSSIPLCCKYNKALAVSGAVTSLFGAIFMLIANSIFWDKHDSDNDCWGAGSAMPFIGGLISILLAISAVGVAPACCCQKGGGEVAATAAAVAN